MERTAGEGRGMDRRDLLRASAVAGAAAWTAPVIIDSITSPAGALSPCKKYYMKLAGDGVGQYASPGNCYNASPSCNGATDNLTGNNSPTGSNPATNGGYTWTCTGNNQSSGNKFRSVFATAQFTFNSTNYQYYRIVLSSGCRFSSSDTTYAVVGNYGWTTTGTCRAAVAGSATATGPTSASQPGLYQNGGNTVWIRRSFDNQTLNWIYLEFCCDS